MKLRGMHLAQIILAISTLSACGVSQTPMQMMPQKPGFQAAANPRKMAVGQLNYANEMRGFSSIQNPMRTMAVEYTTSTGQKMSMRADRFLKSPDFNLAVTNESAANPNQSAQYFSSKEKSKVQALFDTLRQLDTQAAEAAHRDALLRILDHLKSAL